jgi:CubicO group peptidase (beta-lactamase class C family)
MFAATRIISIRKVTIFLGLLVSLAMVLLVQPQLSHASSHNQNITSPVASLPGTSSEIQDMATFFDALIPQQLDEYHIPGAAIVVVKNGEMVFAKGYGFANLEQERPVVVDQTLFRTGSVAKLFTWTAVMQLVEQGKLDLDANVNHYLSDFQIPDTFPEPITIEHLLTHTAGFEDLSAGAIRARPQDLEPFGAFIARTIPTRIFPSGEVSAYSNYGTALAGYIVEQVSGQPFEQYVQRNIFNPLGMLHTTFNQPVPASMADELASGYIYADGAFKPKPFEIYQIGPAGGASATASDMARFMVTHLQDGTYADERILDEKTAQQMRHQQFSNDPRLTGLAYGFYELRLNERLLLTHAGDTSLFRSQVFLLPQENLGLYVVYNAPGGGLARLELAQAFFDRFYPTKPFTVPLPPSDAAQRASQLQGSYLSTRGPQTTIEKLRLLFEPMYQPITVRATGDGYLESDHPAVRRQKPDSYQPSRWVELEPNLYVQTNGRDYMAFRQYDQGNLMMFLDSTAARGYRKLTWFEELLFQPLLPLGLVVVLLGVLIFALFDKQALPAARWLAVGAGGVVLTLLLGLIAYGLPGFTSYLFGKVLPVWWVLFALPPILVILTIGLAVSTLIPWTGVSVLRHLPYALAVLAATGLLWWCGYWNLLGWRF